MKKVRSRNILRRLIIEEIDLMLEQEEDLFGAEEEEPAEEEEVEEEEAEEGGGEETEEADEETVEEEEVEPEGEEASPLGKSIDDDLNALFVDFESQALRVGKEQADQLQANEVKRSLSYVLFEQEEVEEEVEEEVTAEDTTEVPIDLETFASDVARLAMNYASLLDMEDLILVKARDYIKLNHSEEKAGELMDILDLRYQLGLQEKEPIVAPIAVGAIPGGGAA